MCELGDIKFDKIMVNTNLALKYFKEKNNEFHPSAQLNAGDLIQEFDGYNKIHVMKSKNFDTNQSILDLTFEQSHVTHGKLLKLAKLVEENGELFSQIEYAIRNIPVDEVKNYDIKLIVQNLSCTNYVTSNRYAQNSTFNGIMLKADTPLANIGFVAQLLNNRENVKIYATKETAAVSYLFTELCRAVHLNSIDVFFVPNDSVPKELYDMAAIPAIANGCVGVISERSDLDSAIDVLLNTTTKYPWKLTRIYVQESVYDKFKEVMAFKSGVTEELKTLKPLCDSVYVYHGKYFLADYAGTADSANGKVLVEAYRTTKELIALVTKYEAHYVSVWSSDISEANEIAYLVPSPIVWVNSYGIFDGPPNTSQAIYKEFFAISPLRGTIVDEKDKLLAQQAKWSKKTFDERRRIVEAAATEFLEKNKDTPFSEEVEELIIALRNLESDDFVSVKEGRICVGLSVPCKVVLVNQDVDWQAPYIAKLLSSGAALVFRSGGSENSRISNMKFLSCNVPISENGIVCPNKNEVFAPYESRTKVVWTYFGTIFAN